MLFLHKRTIKKLLDKILYITAFTIFLIATIQYIKLVHTADKNLYNYMDSTAYEQTKQDYITTLQNN